MLVEKVVGVVLPLSHSAILLHFDELFRTKNGNCPSQSLYEVTRDILRIVFGGFYSDIEEQLKDLLQFREHRKKRVHSLDQEDGKRTDPSSRVPGGVKALKKKEKPRKLDQRSALVAATFPSISDMLVACDHNKSVHAFDDFFPSSLK